MWITRERGRWGLKTRSWSPRRLACGQGCVLDELLPQAPKFYLCCTLNQFWLFQGPVKKLLIELCSFLFLWWWGSRMLKWEELSGRTERWEQRDFIARKPCSRDELSLPKPKRSSLSSEAGNFQTRELQSPRAPLGGPFLTAVLKTNRMDGGEIKHPKTGNGSVH